MPGILGASNEIVVADGWVQLSPFGEWPNVAGLQIFDRAAAEEMVREFNSARAKLEAKFRGAPLYVGHPDAPDGEVDPAYGKRAVGWIKELQVRGDGLWGRPKWSAAGNEIIDEGYFQFLSPYWGMRPVAGRKKAFMPVALFSVGLTNNPNIPGLPVGKNEKTDTMKKEDRDKLIAALGLKAEATDDGEIITALNELKKTKDDADAKAAAAETKKTELETALNTANAELKKVKGEIAAANSESAGAQENFKTERKARIDQELTFAANETRIKEADRAAWAAKLTTDFEAEVKNLRALKPALNTKPRTAALGARKSEVAVPANRMAAINTAVSKFQKENGVTHTAAWNAVKSASPELFEEAAA